MTQPTLGLALSGGGVRGFAHIGVLKTLQQAGIPIGCISGTSMGGIIAAAYACGVPIEQIEEKALGLASRRQLIRLVDVTGQRRGFLSAARIRDYLTDFFLDRTFESLPIPLALTAVDLQNGQEVIFNSGLVFPAVLATMAVPGLFPPVKIGRHLLVDGGVLNNLPIDLLCSMGAVRTIGVDAHFYQHERLGWSGDGRQPFPHLIPEFFQDLYQAEMIMISKLTQVHLEVNPPDLLLYPPIPTGVTMLTGFSHAADVIAAGAECAQEALPQIEKLLAS